MDGDWMVVMTHRGRCHCTMTPEILVSTICAFLCMLTVIASWQADERVDACPLPARSGNALSASPAR